MCMCVYMRGKGQGKEGEKGKEEERVRHQCGIMSITCMEIRGQFLGFSSSKEGSRGQTIYKRSIDFHC